jgi:hypothetical protein
MASKIWKYEADCQRISELIERTSADANRPGWSYCAKKVVAALRAVRPRATPLALYFISASAKEMLEGRHDTAKLCLTVAQAIPDKALMNKILDLFGKAFAAPCNCAACQKRAEALKKLGDTVNALEFKLKAKMEPGKPVAPSMAQVLSSVLEDMGGKLLDLPDGVSEIEILPGIKAHVSKQKFGEPSPVKSHKAKAGTKAGEPGNNRWN